MDDLISRQAVMSLAKDICVPTKEGSIYPHRCIDPDAIRELPSAQPERKTGKWIKHKDRSCWHCSECNADDYYAYSWDCDTGEYKFQDNFCPNCGAKMEVET